MQVNEALAAVLQLAAPAVLRPGTLPGCITCRFCGNGYWPGNGAKELKHGPDCLYVKALRALDLHPECEVTRTYTVRQLRDMSNKLHEMNIGGRLDEAVVIINATPELAHELDLACGELAASSAQFRELVAGSHAETVAALASIRRSDRPLKDWS